jgi:hypothetical protein
MPEDATQHFVTAILEILDETFDTHHGYYLDRGTSMFETLATISAAEASRPVSASCASIAAQVNHTTYYLDVLRQDLDPTHTIHKVDWQESWNVPSVNDEEWAAMVQALRAASDKVIAAIQDTTDWTGDSAGAIVSIAAHTAHHLGEIRQALCTIQNRA